MILRLFDGEHWGFAPTSWRKQSKVHGLSRPCLFPPSALSLPLKEVIPGKVFSLTFLRAFYLSAVAFVGNSLMPLWLLFDPRLEFPKQIASMQTHCCLWKSCSSPCLHWGLLSLVDTYVFTTVEARSSVQFKTIDHVIFFGVTWSKVMLP